MSPTSYQTAPPRGVRTKIADTSRHENPEVRRRRGDGADPDGYRDGMDDVRWLDERELRAWRSLQFMQMRLNAALARQLAADSALSYPDYLLLVALTDQPDGRLRLFELARDVGWEKSRLSHQVSRMADRGLVAKERCDLDRRGSYVVLTPAGRKAIEAAAPGHVEAVRRLFVDKLTPEQLDLVREAAEVVLAGLEAHEPES